MVKVVIMKLKNIKYIKVINKLPTLLSNGQDAVVSEIKIKVYLDIPT